MANEFTLTAYPRLHLGLIDLGWATMRSYGGAGFSIDCMPTTLEVTAAASFSVHLPEELDDFAQADVAEMVARIRRRWPHIRGTYAFTRFPPSHVGLGSKTTLLLSLARAIAEVNRLGVEVGELQQITGRGGASGIGVHAFFNGGFIVDAGHERILGESHLPSRFRGGRNIPPVVVKLPIPQAWRFTLVLPAGNCVYSRGEREFFLANTPIPKQEVLETLAAIYHGVVPAVASGRLDWLAEALASVHRAGFKRRELDAQSELAKSVFQRLGETGRPVGLSSLGPLIYIVTDACDDRRELSSLLSGLNAEVLGTFQGRDGGYCITDG